MILSQGNTHTEFRVQLIAVQVILADFVIASSVIAVKVLYYFSFQSCFMLLFTSKNTTFG